MIKKLTKESLVAIIETCKDELTNNCQMPSEHISGDFLCGKSYAYKELIQICNDQLKKF